MAFWPRLPGPDFLAPWPRRGIVRLIGLVSIFRIPWPRRGFVRLIGLVSMHLNNYYVATESFPPPKVPPPKIPIRHPVNYLRLRFRWLQIPTACVLNKESCWRSNPKSPGLLFWVSYTLEDKKFTTDSAVTRIEFQLPQLNPAKLPAEQRFPDWIFLSTKGCGECCL